jgi:MerR family transcriptional regulator, thiopeptide resistance regulator
MLLKIGELARRTGLTVRTLHHYDDIGLLSPSGRSASGYRLYDIHDIERLHRIQALRQLDIPLAEIATLLQGDTTDLQTVIDRQISALEHQARRALQLRDRLAQLRNRIHSKDEADVDEWLDTLTMMAVYEKYFTPAELEKLRQHGGTHAPELDRLVVRVRSLMERGEPPESEESQSLARQWLLESLNFMAGDSRLIHKLDAMHRQEDHASLRTGADAAMLDYMARVTAEFRLRIYARHLDPSIIAEVRPRYFEHYRRWPPLFAELRELREQGAAADSPEVLDLAARWIRLFQDTWGTDPARREQVLAVNAREPDVMAGSGTEPDALALVSDAINHIRRKRENGAGK